MSGRTHICGGIQRWWAYIDCDLCGGREEHDGPGMQALVEERDKALSNLEGATQILGAAEYERDEARAETVRLKESVEILDAGLTEAVDGRARARAEWRKWEDVASVYLAKTPKGAIKILERAADERCQCFALPGSPLCLKCSARAWLDRGDR